MKSPDLETIHRIASALPEAPHWPVSAYARAIDPESSPKRIALAATSLESDLPVGFLIASVIAPDAELETIVVASSGQRRGVGTCLLNALTEELRSGNVTRLILEVRASNLAAIEFYGKHGFRETGRRPRYYADPEEDAVLMGLELA